MFFKQREHLSFQLLGPQGTREQEDQGVEDVYIDLEGLISFAGLEELHGVADVHIDMRLGQVRKLASACIHTDQLVVNVLGHWETMKFHLLKNIERCLYIT
jgi:hypothetical protein